MVDMMAQYQEAGFAIGVKELPDYIPLYLEFLSTREDIEAREGLADVAHLLALLAARLDERESAYASCFRALLQISGAEPHQAIAELRAQVAAEVHGLLFPDLVQGFEGVVAHFGGNLGA